MKIWRLKLVQTPLTLPFQNLWACICIPSYRRFPPFTSLPLPPVSPRLTRVEQTLIPVFRTAAKHVPIAGPLGFFEHGLTCGFTRIRLSSTGHLVKSTSVTKKSFAGVPRCTIHDVGPCLIESLLCRLGRVWSDIFLLCDKFGIVPTSEIA